MKAFVCLIMTALLLNVSAFASEVWVFDPDEGAVVVNDDGTLEPWDSGFALLPTEDPSEEPAGEIPAGEDPGEELTPELLPEDPLIEDPAPEEFVEDPVLDPEPIEDPFEDPDFIYEDFYEDEFPSYAVMSLNESDRSVVLDPDDMSMKDVAVMVLGEYSPRTQTVTQYLSDGSSDSYTEIVPGVAGMDWEWISGAALFAIVLFSFFKFVGVLLRNG